MDDSRKLIVFVIRKWWKMFEVNEYVMYSFRGICKVADIKDEGVTRTKKLYYILQPIKDSRSTLMTPVDSEKVPIRGIVPSEEAQKLMDSLETLEIDWIANNRLRTTTFTEIARTGELAKTIGILLAFLRQQIILKESNKKLTLPDEKIFKIVESLVYEELGYALGMKEHDIRKKLIKVL